jgi:hypothetical protein
MIVGYEKAPCIKGAFWALHNQVKTRHVIGIGIDGLNIGHYA